MTNYDWQNYGRNGGGSLNAIFNANYGEFQHYLIGQREFYQAQARQSQPSSTRSQSAGGYAHGASVDVAPSFGIYACCVISEALAVGFWAGSSLWEKYSETLIHRLGKLFQADDNFFATIGVWLAFVIFGGVISFAYGRITFGEKSVYWMLLPRMLSWAAVTVWLSGNVSDGIFSHSLGAYGLAFSGSIGAAIILWNSVVVRKELL